MKSSALEHLRLGRMQEHDTGRGKMAEPLPSAPGCDLQEAKGAVPAGTLRCGTEMVPALKC